MVVYCEDSSEKTSENLHAWFHILVNSEWLWDKVMTYDLWHVMELTEGKNLFFTPSQSGWLYEGEMKLIKQAM